jgi:hypothetical protein
LVRYSLDVTSRAAYDGVRDNKLRFGSKALLWWTKKRANVVLYSLRGVECVPRLAHSALVLGAVQMLRHALKNLLNLIGVRFRRNVDLHVDVD